jgi:hypothetical protein
MKAVAVFPESHQVKLIEQEVPGSPGRTRSWCACSMSAFAAPTRRSVPLLDDAASPAWLDPQTPSHERGAGLSALVLGIGPVGC